MNFFKYTKKLIDKKTENKTSNKFEQNIYQSNPFKENKHVAYIWIDKDTG